jgi:hypothetical protein
MVATLPLAGKENIAGALVSLRLTNAERKVAAGLRLLAADPAPGAVPTPGVRR